MQERNKRDLKERGITLIALVVTIVVLLILAGVTVNTLFNDNGILNYAKTSGNEFKIQAVREKIEAIKLNWEAEKVVDSSITIEKLWEDLEKAEIIDSKDENVSLKSTVTENENEITKYEIETKEGYLVEIIVTKKSNGSITVEIGEIEESTNPLPRISIKETTANNNSITVKVEVSRLGNGEITYLYKLRTSEAWSEPQKMTGTEVKITGLEINKMYDIKIIAKNENGEREEIGSAIIDTLAPQEAEVTFSKTLVEVEQEFTATVTLKDNESGIDLSKSKWEFNQTSTAIGIEENSYTNTFAMENDTIKLKTTTDGSWYLHVLSIDKCGNKKETIKGIVKTGIVAENYTWTQDKTIVTGTHKVTGATITKEVGTEFEYNCGVSSYTGGWKVLGAENEKLLIMSTIDIGTLQLSGKYGYNLGVNQLNSMCNQYGTNARSIKVEDINRVTGYDPNNTGDGKKFKIGEWGEYESKVTYTASKITNSNGLIETSLSNKKYDHPAGKLIGTGGNTSLITETSTYYYYHPNTLTTTNTGSTKGISTTSKAYKLLFRIADNSRACNYWLASLYVDAMNKYSDFGLRYVDDSVSTSTLWYSGGSANSTSKGVRAVVSL